LGRVTLHGNAGYALVGGDSDDTIAYGVALEYSVIPKLALVGEVFAETENDFDKETHTVTPLVGLRYHITDKITLDTAMSAGVCYGKKTDYGVISGMTVAF